MSEIKVCPVNFIRRFMQYLDSYSNKERICMMTEIQPHEEASCACSSSLKHGQALVFQLHDEIYTRPSKRQKDSFFKQEG